MNTKQKLLIVNEFHPETVKKLDVIYQTHKLWLIPPEQQQQFFEETCADCYAAATGSWICDERVYQLPQLRLISCFGVGVDGIDFAQTEERGISVSNTPDVLNDAVAEVATG